MENILYTTLDKQLERLNNSVIGAAAGVEMFWGWFCTDSSLNRRAEKLTAKLKLIANSPRFDQRHVYAFYQNSQPFGKHPTYDEIKICDRATGDVIFCICFGDKREDTSVQVWAKTGANDSEFQIVKSGTWRGALVWFMNPSPEDAGTALRPSGKQLEAGC